MPLTHPISVHIRLLSGPTRFKGKSGKESASRAPSDGYFEGAGTAGLAAGSGLIVTPRRASSSTIRAAPEFPCWASSSVFLEITSNCARSFWACSIVGSCAALTDCNASRSRTSWYVWNANHATMVTITSVTAGHGFGRSCRLPGSAEFIAGSPRALRLRSLSQRRGCRRLRLARVDGNALLGEDRLQRVVLVADGQVGQFMSPPTFYEDRKRSIAHRVTPVSCMRKLFADNKFATPPAYRRFFALAGSIRETAKA
jgi:hypothetical protein